jgi:hypothetical protein
MGFDEPGRPGPGAGDVIAFGRDRPPRRRRTTGALLAGAAALIVAVTVINVAGHSQRPVRPSRPGPPPVVVSQVHRHLLGVTGNWELFARGLTYLVRIQLARGTITRTQVPPLESNNPDVDFLVGPNEAIVRSYDQVPGYVVPDGEPARQLTGVLAADAPGPLLPGPRSSQAWTLMSGPGRQQLALVSLDGQVSRTSIRLPSGGALPATAIADGDGDVLLMTSANRIYDAGPTWDRVVPTTTVAVGPTGWLSLSCRTKRCRDVVTSAATGVPRVLPGPALQDSAFTWPTLGVIAPDGAIAAVPAYGSTFDGGVTLRLVDLRTGAIGTLKVALSPDPGYQSMAWSPDSTWLFVVSASGRIVAVNTRTGQLTGLGVRLPPVTQLAIRS